MNILKTKSTRKYLNKISKHVVSRQNKYFRRNVHINHKDTFIRIMRIKSDKQFNLEIKGYKSLPADVCFLLHHIDRTLPFDNYLKIKDSEFIITDSKTNKIISLNQKLKNYPDFINIWIIKKNNIEYLKLNVGDIFFTR